MTSGDGDVRLLPARPLTTRRLVLRRHRHDDLEAFAAFLADAQSTRYMAFTDDQRTPAGAAAMLDAVITSYRSPDPIVSLTIADGATDRYLGSCGLNPLGTPGDYEVYYTVVTAERGRGIATEALGALAGHALSCAVVERLVAHVVPENIASIRVAENTGFVDDGPVRRRAVTGQIAGEALEGRRYVRRRPLTRPAGRPPSARYRRTPVARRPDC